MKDKISIIVPIYNAQKYLNRLLSEIKDQTYKNWELILIDDGSYDSSLDICNFHKNNYDNIKIISCDHCGLPGKIRNIGIKNSTGGYITFIDADDRINTQLLESLYKSFKNNNVQLSICNFIRIKDPFQDVQKRSDNIIKYDKFFNEKDIYDYSLKVLDQQNKNLLFSYCWGKLYDAKIIKDNNILFNEELCTFEDIEFNFNYLKYIKNIQYINPKLYEYTIHENYNSITYNTNFDRFFNYITSISTMSFYLKHYFEEEKINKKRGNAIISMTVLQLLRANVNNNIKILDSVINNRAVRYNLKYYRPKKGESILIPLFILFKFKKLLRYTIKYKSRKRYKKCA